MRWHAAWPLTAGCTYLPRCRRSKQRRFIRTRSWRRLPAWCSHPFLLMTVWRHHSARSPPSAYGFPAPLTPLRGGREPLEVLELFHGPTAAFKDFGARFLAGSMSRLQPPESTTTIMVATSGDTGSAVAAAFHDRPGFEVVILFPRNRVSPRQEQQLTCWSGNVRSFSVDGIV